MKTTAYIFFLLLWSVTGIAQQTIPASISVPANSVLVLHVYAKGVQIYRCDKDPKDTSRYVWIFQEPRAKLYLSADLKKQTGDHFLNADKNPTWKLSDNGLISGAKIQQAAASEPSSIPWLLLRAIPGSGKGRLAEVNYIQRIATHGGAAPGEANQAENGKLLEVPYTAEYLFYKGN